MRFFVLIVLFSLLSCSNHNNDYKSAFGGCGKTKLVSISEIKTLPVYKDIAAVKLGSFDTREQMPRDKNNNIDLNGFLELKEVSGSGKDSLFNILVNYDTGDSARSISACYEPRNAMLFFDSKGAIIGYVEICFACRDQDISPSNLQVGKFCDEKYEAILKFFERNGIEFGITPESYMPASEIWNRLRSKKETK
ncbi:MAG: hypothetical protein WDO14_13845 [Bacteroidota bacterium]